MVEDVLTKGIGKWLIALVSGIIVFATFMIGHSVNGIMPELAVMLAGFLGSTEVLAILIIEHFTKIKT